MGKQGFTPAAPAPFGDKGAIAIIWSVLPVLDLIMEHARTGKQGSMDQVVTTGRRRCADMRSPE